VADPDDKAIAELERYSRKRGARVMLVMGVGVMLLGIVLVALGYSYEEPTERIATRDVPAAAPIGLMIFGGFVALGGIWMIVRARRDAKGK
jgi:hypothetical protein